MSKKTSIGGQALMEGVMMLGPKKITAAFCDENGNVTAEDIEFTFTKEKFPIVGKPIIRGVFSFIDTMRLSMKSMDLAAKQFEIEDEPQGKFEKWLTDKFGDKIGSVIVGLGVVLGLALSVLLFLFLPVVAFNGITMILGEQSDITRAIVEGVLRMAIFIGYVAVIALIPDIKRVFMYHGAEHKTIFCYENELPLTVENVKIQSRFHPRCGTSFLVILIVLGIVVGFFIPFSNPILRTGAKILTLPLVVSLGYELIKICGRFDNVITRIISAPGMWVQRLTTKEPDDKMIETAIKAMESVIPENGEDILV